MKNASKGMSILKWIVGIFVLLFVAYFLFANTIIKTVLEAKLGESYGAEVNINDFDHSLFPTTVTLKGIELTNPTKPTYNQVFVAEANADVALKPLLKSIRNINAMYYPMCQLYLRPVARVSNGYFSGISEVVVIKIDAI